MLLSRKSLHRDHKIPNDIYHQKSILTLLHKLKGALKNIPKHDRGHDPTQSSFYRTNHFLRSFNLKIFVYMF